MDDSSTSPAPWWSAFLENPGEDLVEGAATPVEADLDRELGGEPPGDGPPERS